MDHEPNRILPPLSCTDCGAGPFKDHRGFSSHRRNKHGIAGTPRTVLASRSLKHKTLPKVVHSKKEAAIVPAPAPQILQKRTSSMDEIPPELVGYAMGKLESLAQQIARENNVPEKEFVCRSAEYFAVLSKR